MIAGQLQAHAYFRAIEAGLNGVAALAVSQSVVEQAATNQAAAIWDREELIAAEIRRHKARGDQA